MNPMEQPDSHTNHIVEKRNLDLGQYCLAS
jgi:hypothetical protein